MTEPTNTKNSTFVPLSLTDTLSKPVRTLHSYQHHNNTRPSSSSTSDSLSSNTIGRRRSTHLPPSSSSSSSSVSSNGGGLGLMGVAEKVRELEKKRVKELMCERLGLSCEALGGEGGEKENGLNELHLEGSELGKEKEKDERDEEVKGLRKQVVRLNEENKRLNTRVKGLQEEVVAAKASASVRQGTNGTTTTTVSALEGVGAIQLKELEKSFAEQEGLLAGYQRDAEKSFLTIEAMKKQARRYTDILAKTYGPNYETELGLDQENASSLLTTTKVLSATTGLSSPAMRNQRDRVRKRMSFGGAAAVVTPIASRVGGIEHGIVEEEHNEEEGTDGEPSSAEVGASAKEEGAVEQARYEMLRGYVEGVQTLLRSMEQRLLKRDYELEMMEQRAREEKQLAEAKVDHVEKLISGIQV